MSIGRFSGAAALAVLLASGAAASELEQAKTAARKGDYRPYLRLAQSGNVEAMNALAEACAFGKQRDMSKAMAWYARAADLGNVRAMMKLGLLYNDSKDYPRALAMFEKAAHAGDPLGMYNFSCYLHNGWGTAKDEARAMEWLRKGAEAREPLAMFELGCEVADPAQAVEWFKRAARAGNAAAMNELGRCYEDGNGIGKDAKKAAECYHAGAKKGNAMAMYNLARGLEETNPNAALGWLQRSARAGYAPAAKEGRELAAYMQQESNRRMFDGLLTLADKLGDIGSFGVDGGEVRERSDADKQRDRESQRVWDRLMPR